MRTKLLIVFAFASALLARPAANAEDFPTVWSGLVFATNDRAPKPMPPEIAPFKTKLEHIFGYSHFELIGQHTEIMDDPLEHWLVPGKTFCLSASSQRSAEAQGYTVQLQLFHERNKLVSTKVWL